LALKRSLWGKKEAFICQKTLRISGLLWNRVHNVVRGVIASLNISDRSLQRILHKDLNFHPYKIQVVQELKEHDLISCTNFCHEILPFFG
jgi:hypothetical protein